MSRGLGKGLDALLPASAKARDQENGSDLVDILVTDLQVGAYQPRKNISEEDLSELALSIKAQGIIQPLVVRRLLNNSYEIVAGERRWRAAQQIGLTKVPCIIRQLTDQAAGAIALIENMQRKDLNAMEEAQALYRLTNEFSLTHQQMADALGKSRTTISNLLRLNLLAEDVKQFLIDKKIEMGHARALLSLKDNDQITLANQIIKDQLTVRKAELLVKRFLENNIEKDKKHSILNNNNPIFDEINKQVAQWQCTMKQQLEVNTLLKLSPKGKGSLIIKFENQQKLLEIINLLQ